MEIKICYNEVILVKVWMRELGTMTKKVRNVLAVFDIIIYCIISVIYASVPMVQYIGLIVLGVHEIGVSIIYCIFNATLDKKELKYEIISNIIILIVITFVLFRFVI